jgi:hypothetical protein
LELVALVALATTEAQAETVQCLRLSLQQAVAGVDLIYLAD